MSSSPKKPRKLPPRPKIKLPVPGQFPGHYPQTPMGYVTTPYGTCTPMPTTPVSGQPTLVYDNKTSGFVFTNFKGFKDWTKSGMSVGEKSAFWLYEKVSSWSKRWFTHLFLFFVLFLYSILGAFLFIYIEGKYENTIQEDIKKERDEMIQQIRDLWNDKELMEDSEKWKGCAKNHLMLYEEKLYQFLKKLNFQSRPDNVNWAFWNAVIYCSTIYTTIDIKEESSEEEIVNLMNEQDGAGVSFEGDPTEIYELEQNSTQKEADAHSSYSPSTSNEDAAVTSIEEENAEVSNDENIKSAESQKEIIPHILLKSRRPEKSEAPLQEDGTKGKEVSVVKNNEAQPPKTRERPEETERQQHQQPPAKVSRKPRDQSDGTELRRRLGSPEAAKTRSTRHLSPAARTPEPNDEQLDTRGARKRVSSRHRYQNPSDEDEPPDRSQHHKIRRSPSQPKKKQIIPLSDESLIEDISRAKRAYIQREPIDDYEYEDDEDLEEEYIHPRRRREKTVRRRKLSVAHTDQEQEEIRKSCKETSSWFSWIPFFGKRKQKIDDLIEENDKKKQKEKDNREASSAKAKLEKTASTASELESDKVTLFDFFRSVRHFTSEFNEFCRQNPQEVQILRELRNLCIVETLLTLIVCGLGGFAFRFTEGAFESFYKCGVKRVKRDFLDSLWNFSHNMREDDWKSMARRKLMDFEEQLHAAHEAGVQTYSGQRSWTFLNSMVYCLTVITTIGYGHISPSTTTGRALTIIYALFGIPMFLIVLADFGKLFTRGIKFLWAFVRRLYYNGSCRKVRRTVPMQEMMKGVQLVYDLATFRRPSQMTPEELVEIQRQQQTVLGLDGNTPQQQQPDSPSTPTMITYEVDDEFNLPISVAITILVLYIFVGATVFNIFEDWTFFESFYFVFISMSTIGFGDFVPQDPLYMMLSIVYLIFGLALTSMCINVVQVMLADQFKHASQKIGATIGFHVSEEDGSLKPAPPEPVEIAEVHNAIVAPANETKDKVAPKAKQEDVEL